MRAERKNKDFEEDEEDYEIQESNIDLLERYLYGSYIDKKKEKVLTNWIKSLSTNNPTNSQQKEIEEITELFWVEFKWDKEVVQELLSEENFQIPDYKGMAKTYKEKLTEDIKNLTDRMLKIFEEKKIKIDVAEVKINSLANNKVAELKVILEMFILSGDIDDFLDKEISNKLSDKEKEEYASIQLSYEKKEFIKNKNIEISYAQMIKYINNKLYINEGVELKKDTKKLSISKGKIQIKNALKQEIDAIYKTNKGIYKFIDTTTDTFAMIDYIGGEIKDVVLPINKHYKLTESIAEYNDIKRSEWEYYFVPSINIIKDNELRKFYPKTKKKLNKNLYLKNFITSISKLYQTIKYSTTLEDINKSNDNIKTYTIFYDNYKAIYTDNPKVNIEEIFEIIKKLANHIGGKEKLKIDDGILNNLYKRELNQEFHIYEDKFYKDLLYALKLNKTLQLFVIKFLKLIIKHNNLEIEEMKFLIDTIFPTNHPYYDLNELKEKVELTEEKINLNQELLNKDKELRNKDKELRNKDKVLENKDKALKNKDKELEQYKKIMSNYEKYKKIWLGLYTYFNRASSSNRIGDEKYIEILNKYGTVIIVDTPKGKIKEVEEFKILELKPDEFFNDMKKLYIKVFKGFLNSEKFKERINLMIEIKKDLLLNYSTIIEGLELENRIEKENIINLIIKNIEFKNEEINDILEDILNISNEEIKEKFLNELNNNPILIDMIKNGIKEKNIELLKKEINKTKTNLNIILKNKFIKL